MTFTNISADHGSAFHGFLVNLSEVMSLNIFIQRQMTAVRLERFHVVRERLRRRAARAFQCAQDID
jgi:hypothetical protein